MRKRSLLERAFRAWLGLPAWLRPAVASSFVVLAIMIPRVCRALPFAAHRESPSALFLALGAAAGAAFLAGLAHGLSRPALRKLGRAGDYLSGVVMLYAYLGALIAASPWVFERSAIPKDTSGWWIWLGMGTVLGLVAGHAWFAGPEGIERIAEQRSQPQVRRLAAEAGDATATLVSGWVAASGVAETLERMASAVGVRLPVGESARVATLLAAEPMDAETDDDDEGGIEWQLPLEPPAAVRLARADELVSLDVLLEHDNERHADAVHAVLTTRTVDPLAA